MKKLTAGIFATILGVTAMGAASAAMPEGFTSVATTNYVKEAVGAAKTTVQSNIDTLAGNVYTKTQTDNLLGAKANSADLATVATTGQYSDLNGKPDVYTKTETNNLLNDKADKSMVGTLPAGQSTVVGYIESKTANIASDDTVSALDTRVQTIEGDYLKSAALTPYAKTADVEATYATKTEAQGYADAAESAAIAAAATAAEKYIDDTELTAKNYATKTEAQGYADAKDTAIAAAQKAGTDAAAAAATADGKAVAAQAAADKAQNEVDALETVVDGKADKTTLANYVLWSEVDNSYVDDATN